MVAINNIRITTNQSIAAIEPDKNLEINFLFQNLGNRYDELRLISSGDGTRGGLNKQIISKIEVKCPSTVEQTKIGNFFKSLDTLITVNQRKTKNSKKRVASTLISLFITLKWLNIS